MRGEKGDMSVKENFESIELEFCVFDAANIISTSEGCKGYVCDYDYPCDTDGVCKRQLPPV